MLNILADQGPLPRALVEGLLQLPQTTLLDYRLLTPILPSLNAAQVENCLPLVLALPPPALKSAIVRLLHAEQPPLSPATLLSKLHVIEAPDLPLKALINAVQESDLSPRWPLRHCLFTRRPTG